MRIVGGHTGSRKYEINDIAEVTTGTGLVVHENTAWRKTGILDGVSWTTQNDFQIQEVNNNRKQIKLLIFSTKVINKMLETSKMLNKRISMTLQFIAITYNSVIKCDRKSFKLIMFILDRTLGVFLCTLESLAVMSERIFKAEPIASCNPSISIGSKKRLTCNFC